MALKEFYFIGNQFGDVSFIAVFVIIAAVLHGTFYSAEGTFLEIIAAGFCIITPDYDWEEVCLRAVPLEKRRFTAMVNCATALPLWV